MLSQILWNGQNHVLAKKLGDVPGSLWLLNIKGKVKIKANINGVRNCSIPWKCRLEDGKWVFTEW